MVIYLPLLSKLNTCIQSYYTWIIGVILTEQVGFETPNLVGYKTPMRYGGSELRTFIWDSASFSEPAAGNLEGVNSLIHIGLILVSIVKCHHLGKVREWQPFRTTDLFMLEKKCNYLPVASWLFGSRCFGTLNPANMMGIYMSLKGFFPKRTKGIQLPTPHSNHQFTNGQFEKKKNYQTLN